MRGPIIATAARTHWRHDATGRVLPNPANDVPPVRPTLGAGSLNPGADRPRLSAGVLFSPFHEAFYDR